MRTLNQREEIAEGRQRDTAYAKPHPEAHTPSTHSKPSIKHTSFDGSTSWEDYKAQFDLIAELNYWDTGTKSIYLAATLKRPAQGILRDLEDAQRRLACADRSLEQQFGSENQNEIHQVRSRMRREETTRVGPGNQVLDPTSLFGCLSQFERNTRERLLPGCPAGE